MIPGLRYLLFIRESTYNPRLHWLFVGGTVSLILLRVMIQEATGALASPYEVVAIDCITNKTISFISGMVLEQEDNR